MDRVAIITPVYNSGKYLTYMLESLVNQTFKSFDLILVNDKSTDESETICKEYESKYPNIFYLELHVNSGPGIARNKGLDFIRNKQEYGYFAFVDSDDIIAETYLERMVNAVNTCKTKIVVSKITRTDFVDSTFTTVISSNELYKHRKQYKSFPGNGVGAKLFDISLLNSFIFPSERHEDLFIIPSIILNERNISLLDASLYHYRYRSESESHHASFHPSMLDRLSALRHNLEFVLSHNIDAKYHFYNEYFEYLNYLISITKDNEVLNESLLVTKRKELNEYKYYIFKDIGRINYYRYLFTEKSIIFKLLVRLKI